MNYLVGSLSIILCHIVMPSVPISLLAVALALQSVFFFIFLYTRCYVLFIYFPAWINLDVEV